ncbi:methyl-CpG-binding domain protein 2-like [Pomacea canaliculata]|uniref:methyl-CpG-binding domain protein 2-like n=1 Tax=Pomacea canaliculata TaxID=400727 RepID=UPI000D72A106|nr:methyl-CpG-binding domain protein 2-like [Pomacea canaliculata]
MSPTRAQSILDDLHSGWTAYGVKRKSGQSAGRSDMYLYSPDGQKFRSIKEVQRYIQSLKQVPVEDKERECSPLENDWCQKLKDTPMTSAFHRRQKGYSSSDPRKTLRKKVKFPEKPSVSLPSENSNKRKREGHINCV